MKDPKRFPPSPRPPYPPRPDMTPDNIPHYPEWPYAPHADWPHGSMHRWNDSEPAHVVPYPVDCCHPDDSECLCVTSADMALWNSYSGLSGLTAFDPSAISAIFDRIQEMDDYEEIAEGYYALSANSAIWDSAAYIPNIYDNISALYDELGNKADYSAISAYCDIGEHPDGTSGDGAIKIWSDSLKDYYYGDRSPHDMTIVGDGTLDRPLRVGKDIVMGAMAANEANAEGGIASQKDLTGIKSDIKVIAGRNNSISAEVNKLIEVVDLLADGLGIYERGEKWILSTPERIKQDSMADPTSFYYC